MPRFHFDFHSGTDVSRDEEGCEFESLELAYLDAYRSMVRIGADLLLDQIDPSSQVIDIRNGDGTVVMTLPFDEVFRPRGTYPPRAKALDQLARSRQLRTNICEACEQARDSIATSRRTLDRVRTVTPWMYSGS